MLFFRRGKKIGDMYAIHVGEYAGQFFILSKKDKDLLGFLAVPTMMNVWASENVFDSGVESGIIRYVERVPKAVRRTSGIKFQENEKIQEFTN